MPGAVRGANGVVHINGDHGVIDYMIDGVALPQELNRDLGGEINLNDLSFVDLVEGAYPAQYGLRFGSVFNMATRAGTGCAPDYGYLSTVRTTTFKAARLDAPLPGGGGFDPAVTGEQFRRADSIRRTSVLRTTTSARSVNSLVSRCRPAAAASRTLPSSIAMERSRSQTTSTTANRPRRTITRRKPTVPGRTVPPRRRPKRRADVRPGVQGFAHCGLRRSGERLHLRRSAGVSPLSYATEVRGRGLRDGVDRSGRHISADDVRVFASRHANGRGLHRPTRLHAKPRKTHARGRSAKTSPES